MPSTCSLDSSSKTGNQGVAVVTQDSVFILKIVIVYSQQHFQPQGFHCQESWLDF